MLQVFRRHAYSWGTRALLGFLILVFIIFFGGLGSYFLQVKPVASIDCYTYFDLITLPGCHNILSDQVDHEAGNIRKAVVNSRGAAAEQMLKGVNLREMAVQSLIEQILIDREAHHLGLSISDDELAKAIASQSVFQDDGHFSTARYLQILRDNNLQPADFESETRTKMLSDTLRRAITTAVSVSSDEARAEFNRLGEKLNLSYLEFPAANFMKGHPTDQQVEEFYRDNKESFREPERVKIDFIRYDPMVLAPQQPPSDDAISQYYEQNLKTEFSHPEQIKVRHILIRVSPDASASEKAAAKSKAQDILQKIKAGASFADLAKADSDDPGTAQNGGDLGYISRGELVKPFEQVAFSLKPGQLGIAETQFGFHVIEVENIKGAKTDSIEEARPRIIAALKEQEGQKIAHQDLDQDTAAAGEGRDLQRIAKERGLVAVETPYFAKTDTIKGAEDDPNLTKEAFSMNPGDIRPITQGDAIYLVKLIDRKPSQVPPFAQIKDKVAQTMLQLRAEGDAHKAAEAVLKQIKTAEAFDAVAQNNHLQVKTTGDFIRASGNLPGIGQLPLAAEAAAAVPSIPSVIEQVMQSNGNSYIFKVISRTPPTDAEWKTASAQFTAGLLQQKQQDAWFNFVNSLKRQASIVIHPDLIGNSTTDNS